MPARPARRPDRRHGPPVTRGAAGAPATAGVTCMKMVVAYIRHEAFEPIREDLLERGFPSLTISEVKGSGRQKGITEHYRGSGSPSTSGRS